MTLAAPGSRDPQRRDTIVAAAMGLIARRGLALMTIEALRDASGASVGSIYGLVGDRRAIALAAVERAAALHRAALTNTLRTHDDAETGVRAVIAREVSWCQEEPDAARILLTGTVEALTLDAGSGLAGEERALLDELARWWRPHVRYGAVRDLDPEVALALWLGGTHALVRSRWAAAGPAPSDAEIAQLAEAAWAALLQRRRLL